MGACKCGGVSVGVEVYVGMVKVGMSGEYVG